MAANNDDPNYDPFNDVDDSYARARKVETLEKGVKYKIIKLFPKISDFKDNVTNERPMNTHCVFMDHDLVCTTILPKKFNNKDARFYTVMNQLIAKDMGPALVFYGKVGMGNEADLLRHTQSVDEQRLKLVQAIEERESKAAKRKKDENENSSSAGPMKRTNSSTV